MEDGKKWIDLIHKLESLEGNKILSKIKHLAISQFTLNRNYQELDSLIKGYEKDLSIWSIDNRAKLDLIQREFLRLLHNYLSSIFSLVGHTYAFRDDISNENIEKFILDEINRFKEDSSLVFLKDLRTYTQHYKLPFSTASLSFKSVSQGRGISEQKLELNLDELSKWSKWTKKSKEFLETQDKKIDIKKVIDFYQKNITDLYKSIYDKIIKVYEKELEEYINLEREIFLLQQKMDKERKSKK